MTCTTSNRKSKLFFFSSLSSWYALVTSTVLLLPHAAHAHEGHAALPTKGLTVQGETLLLSEGASAAIDLKTEKVVLANIQKTVRCNARVELPWQQQVLITTQMPGRVARVLVRPGDSVTKGQELASIESLELEALQLTMLQADAELTFAEEQFARQDTLSKQGVIAGSAALETESTVRQRTAELEIAICKLRALGLSEALLDQVRQTRKPITSFSLTSPISGVVAEADIRAGQIVKTTEHLFHIVDLSQVWVRGEVLEGEVADVRLGQPTVIQFKSLPGELFSGAIDHLHLKMDEKRRTRAVAVALDNREGQLRPGMFGEMKIEIGRSAEAVVCPTEGIIRRLGEEYVLLRRGEGKYIRQPVKIGIRNDRQVEILDGLFPGDQVVVNGNHVLFSLFANETPEQPSNSTSAGDITDSSPPEHVSQRPESHPERNNITVVQGTVELPTDRKAFASSRIEGRIAKVLVAHSGPVRAGQILAEVESLELRNLQGELLECQTKLSWTRERIGRLLSSAAHNVTAKKELWKLQTDQRVLENQLESLTRRLSLIGVPEAELMRVRETDLSAEDCDLTLVRSIPIRSAIDGVVADFDVVPGQIVNAQDTLFEIHDTSTVWVKGYAFQRDARHIKVGQEAKVTFHALPGVAVAGTVVRISPVLNENEQVLPLWIELDNQDGKLIEGMLARVELKNNQSAIASYRQQQAPR